MLSPESHPGVLPIRSTLAGVTCTGWWETVAKYGTLWGLNYKSVRGGGKKKSRCLAMILQSLLFVSFHTAAQRSSSLLGITLQAAALCLLNKTHISAGSEMIL